MKIIRHKTKEIKIGQVKVGARNPIAIQSMAKAPTKDHRRVIGQIKRLERAGCHIVRVAVRDEEDAHAISRIKGAISIPLVADIHFNWKLALCAIKAGADKIRLNPGNVYKRQEIKEIVSVANDYNIPIRVGLNSGSIPRIFRYNHKLSPPLKLARAALDYIGLLEDLKFTRIVVSLKASSVLDTVEAYRFIVPKCGYPLHLGLTASGFSEAGKIKSAVALGILLSEGIGDTFRVSLTAEPQEEVRAAQYILASLGLGNFGPEIISCPACGRTEVDIEKMVNELQDKLSTLTLSLPDGRQALSVKPAKLALMGCVVNGTGEAEGADLAIAFGRSIGVLYKNAKPLRNVPALQAVDELLKEYKNYVKDYKG